MFSLKTFQYSLISVIEGKNVTVIIPCLYTIISWHLKMLNDLNWRFSTGFPSSNTMLNSSKMLSISIVGFCGSLFGHSDCTNHSNIHYMLWMVYILIHFYRERYINILSVIRIIDDHIFDKPLLLSKSFHVHVIGNIVFRFVEKWMICLLTMSMLGLIFNAPLLLSISKKKKKNIQNWNGILCSKWIS